MVRAADLFIAGGGLGPVRQNRRRTPLTITRRIAEPIEEVSSGARRERNAGRRTAIAERVSVIDDVKFATDRVDDNLVEGLVVINRVAMQPIALNRAARKVAIEPAGIIRDIGNVVGFAWIEILNQMIVEPPFPDNVAGHVHLDDGVHLGVGVEARRSRVASGGDALVRCNGFVGDIERGVGSELRIEDTDEIVVRDIIGTRLGIRPDVRSVPVDFCESAESARIILRSVEHIAGVEQMRIRPDRPGVDNTSFHVDEVRGAAHAEKSVTVSGLCLIPIQQFGRPLK